MSVETDTPLETAVETKQQDDIHPAARPFLFLGKESVKRNFIWFPLVGMIICIILGMFYPQAKALPIEKYIPGSWAIYGFLAYSLIVLSANAYRSCAQSLCRGGADLCRVFDIYN